MIIASLLMKIAYIFLAATFHNASVHYPFLNNMGGLFRYLIALPVFVAIMFSGGYITAGIVRRKTLIHSLLVGLVTACIMMIVALQTAEGITKTNLVTYFVMVLATTAGGYYWKRRRRLTS
ncbi:MAG TPA: hypothetical protein EYG71_06410 [Leucothrix sp.]|nr:hypothetical protein [Leucothrix sp.]